MSVAAKFRPGRCLGLFFGLACCLGAAQAAEQVILQLPYRHQFQFAGCYAAEAQGYFKQHGLEVDIRPTTSQRRSALEEVQDGRAQFGVIQGAQLVASRLSGRPVVAVAAIMQHSPLVLLTRAEEGLHSPHDLIGKRVALDETALVSEIRLMLEREGVDFTRIQLVPNLWNVEELKDGLTDAESAFIIDGPYLRQKSGLRVGIIRPLDYGVDFYGDTLFTTESFLQRKRPVVEAMRQAIVEGWAYALRHPEEMVDLIIAHYPERNPTLDRAGLLNEARQVAALINVDLVELGHMNSGRWSSMADAVGRYTPGLDRRRIAGFLYDAPEPGLRKLSWLGWGLVAVSGLALAVLLANRRLQLLVRRRTEELAVSDQRQRDFFELAPAPIMIEDYTAFEPVFAQFRAAGIRDLRAHLKANPAMVRELLPKKRVVAANRLALSRSGFATIEDFDRGLPGIMTEAGYDTFVEELVALWEGVDRLTLERSYFTKNAELIHSLINWEVGSRGGRRDLSNVRLVFTEITALKRAEQARAESEERYRQLFQHSPVAIVEFDYSLVQVWFKGLREQGVTDFQAYLASHADAKTELLNRVPLTDVNHACLALFGANSVEELRANLGYIMTEDTVRVRLRNLQLMWEGRGQADGHITLRRLDGRTLNCAYLWRMPPAEPAKDCRSQVMLTDITEKLGAEQALRESEERYRELFEQAVGGIYRTSPEGRFLSVNPALARILGFDTPEEMIAWSQTNPTSSLYVKPGRRDEFIAALNSRGQLSDFESEARHRAGNNIWISENARAVRNDDGELLYYEGFVTDISARRHLESEIGRASKLEAVGILAGGIAHDFNNILTVVLGNVTLAESDSPAGSPVAARLQDAKRATLRARDLTLQLLTFAKGGEPVRTTIELPELLKEAAGFALHGSSSRGDFQFQPGLWKVNADKGQVGQVIQNLVINAVQAMPGGGVVTLAASNVELPRPGDSAPPLPTGRYVQISVADGGMGIAREHLGKIFDPYFTTKAQGTGLGLASVYSIVRKHEGHIVVESELGQGTVFRFWLPAVSGDARGQAPSPTGSKSPFRARALFMDDEPSIRSMAMLFMERLGYDCDVAVDGAEAIKKYEASMAAGRKYEVVVMDLTVPGGMGGREAMEHLRRIDPNVYAIVSSGYSRDPVLANYQAHGFQAVLPKPYGLEQLTKVMRAALEGPGNPT
ncbi:MAG TPA: ABC transporter substrate-binding protein [Lacunisphaera sp.]|nr:ABC transporter substrate-binding protein [Lacunisphaera sp.]